MMKKIRLAIVMATVLAVVEVAIVMATVVEVAIVMATVVAAVVVVEGVVDMAAIMITRGIDPVTPPMWMKILSMPC
jgi:hypothetical protein